MLPPGALLIAEAFCLAIINTALETQGGIHKLFPHRLQGAEKLYKPSPVDFRRLFGVLKVLAKKA